MKLLEKMISTQPIFDGRIIRVHVDEVSLPNGRTAQREVVNHPGGVGILAIDDDKNVLTVTQYRYVYRQTLLEIPAGKLESGEDPREAAKRELREETGAAASEWRSLGEIYPTPGFCDEIIRLYLARGLSYGEMAPDEDEFLDVRRLPFSVMVDMVLSGEITDGKTCVAILKAKLLLGL